MEKTVEEIPGRRIRAVITLKSGVQLRPVIQGGSTMHIGPDGTIQSLKLKPDDMASPISVVGYLDMQEVAAIVFEHFRDRELTHRPRRPRQPERRPQAP